MSKEQNMFLGHWMKEAFSSYNRAKSMLDPAFGMRNIFGKKSKRQNEDEEKEKIEEDKRRLEEQNNPGSHVNEDKVGISKINDAMKEVYKEKDESNAPH